MTNGPANLKIPPCQLEEVSKGLSYMAFVLLATGFKEEITQIFIETSLPPPLLGTPFTMLCQVTRTTLKG